MKFHNELVWLQRIADVNCSAIHCDECALHVGVDNDAFRGTYDTGCVVAIICELLTNMGDKQ